VSSTATDELRALLRDARALLEWEEELGGGGIPEAAPLPPLVRSAQVPDGSRPMARPEAPQLAARPVPARAAEPERAASPTQQPGSEAASPATRTAGPRLPVLAALADEVARCQGCELARTRTHTVFARGNPESPLVFVGEGPGQEEDRSGLPFVGAAGQLLDKMVGAMGYGRDDVYICNVVKCRPPNNRTPLPQEAGACSRFLHTQLDVVAPRVIVALGRCAAENMGLADGGGWRGRWGKFRGVDVMPTYHPAFLLRSPEFKRPVWEDLQRVMARLAGKG
jgi:uracil-DNA glycosylase